MPPAQTRRRRFMICVTVLVTASLVVFVFLGPLLATSFPSLADRTDFFLHKELNDGNQREQEQFHMKNDQFQQHQIQQQAGNIAPVIESQNPTNQQQQQQQQQQPQIENPPVHVFMPSMTEQLSASEKLQCPASALSFVINATDIKDECEGLRKAFDKTCGGHPTNTREKYAREKRNAGPQRRRLSTLENIRSLNESNVIKVTMWNPIRDYLKVRLDSLKHRQAQETQPDQVEDDNLQPVPPVEEKKKPISPALPTSSFDVTDVTLNESLTLHADLDEIAKAIADITNHTMQEQEDSDASGTKNHNPQKNHEHKSTAEEHAEELKSTAVAVSAVINSPEALETQECCRSILKVFHEECDSPEEEEFNDKRLFVIVCVIALCGMVKSLIRHFKLRWLPEAGGCILVGMIGGLFMRFLPNMDFGFQHDMFLRLMVPPIGKQQFFETPRSMQ